MFALIRFAVFVLLTGGVFYGTGWKLAAIDRETVLEGALWSKILNKSGIPSDAHKGIYEDFVFRDEFIGIQINESYYGFEQTNRFFESPVIEQIGLWFAVGFFIFGLLSFVVKLFNGTYNAETSSISQSLDEDDEDS